MQTEPEIDFQGMKTTRAVEAAIKQYVAQIEER